MIKRRFYRVEHGEGDAPSSASSSSSSSASSSDEEGAEKEERETEEDDEVGEDSNEEHDGGGEKVSGEREESGPQSGYESEESSANEIDCDPSGVMINEEPDITDGRNNRDPMFDEESEEGIAGANQMVSTTLTSPSTTSPSQPELLDCVIRLKSVFKCKMCPRIVCLSEETMKTHLKSKRHGRSEKLFKEGRLKFMLNDDGEIMEEAETHAERHGRTVVAAQNAANQKNKKNKGRQRQRNRIRKKVCYSLRLSYI
ncbi:unnamed protein product [Victoria cruziana]